MLMVASRTQDESKRWYVSAVRGVLVAQDGFMEEETDRIIEAYKLKERLDMPQTLGSIWISPIRQER